MRYSRCSIADLQAALREVNKKYQDNITFNRLDQKGFTLKVKNSKGKGHRIGYSGRRLASACWHVHGDFYDALFENTPNAVIHARGNKITKEEGNWMDWGIGSLVQPLYMSEACDCDTQTTGKIR